MDFINNYAQQVALAQGATGLALALPYGTYRLTLSDGRGADATRYEHVQAVVVDGAATLQRGLEGTEDAEWPAGSWIYCSITAGVLGDMLEQLEAAAWTPANFVWRLEQGMAGQGSSLFWAADAVGAYARVDFGSLFTWAPYVTMGGDGQVDIADGYVGVYGEGDGVGVQQLLGVLSISTGTTAAGDITLTAAPGQAAGYVEPAEVTRAQLASADARALLRLPSAPTAAQDFELEVQFTVPGLGSIMLRQRRLENSGNLTVHYYSGGSEVTVNTSVSMGTFDRVLNLIVADGQVEVASRTSWGAAGKTTLATIPLSSIDEDSGALSFSARMLKTAGTTPRTLQVKRFAAWAALQ
ncbi:hypothetical protein L1F06_015485 [Ectopseudomonas hydrolytica]|uniref:DUF2793 domain-containing protein n=1 Tax=Ectopseudomonas hydrolytica TaxID=2493633 RepID=A0ABY5A3C1_9GAMM|nr:hypothetical protein [Pseudomonas hydrolytica]USR38072.1 hypothetical protein L1F06_015485 [Pseudomonas hydrolytica]